MNSFCVCRTTNLFFILFYIAPLQYSVDDSIPDDNVLAGVDAPKKVSSKKWTIVGIAVFSVVALVAVQFFSPYNLWLKQLDSNTMQQMHRMAMEAFASLTSLIDEATSSSDFFKVTTHYLSDMSALVSPFIIAFKEAISSYSSFLVSDDGDAIPDYSSPSEFV